MSTVVSKNVQIGADGTASNNFTAYQPTTPDGTLRIGNGNSGSVTDAIVLNSSGVVSFTNNPTLSGGTANGVAYLNGSKVLTTGSALTFDGSKLTVKGGNAGQFVLDNAGEQYVQALFQRNATANTGADLLLDGTANTFNFRNLAANMPFVWHLSASAGAPAEQMRLTSTGLGIGTSSPAYKLDVRGAGLVGNFVGSTYGQIQVQSTGTNQNVYLTGNPNGTGKVIFQYGATDVMQYNSSGNLGLGVSPSAWGSGIKVLQFANDASLSTHTAGGNLFLNSNAYYNGTNWIYSNSNLASQYQQFIGKHIWYTAPSGTAGNAISFTQAMTLDASGLLALGTTSPASATRLTLDYPGFVQMVMRSSGTDRISLYGDAAVSAVDAKANPLAFYAGSAERLRITSAGNVGIGTSSPGTRLTVGTSTSSYAQQFRVGNATTDGYESIYNEAYSLASGGAGSQEFYADVEYRLYSGGVGAKTGVIAWHTAISGTRAERMQINQSGNLLVGTTTFSSGQNGVLMRGTSGGYTDEVLQTRTAGTGSTSATGFYNDNGRVGTISTSGTSTAYNTSSDYRLKNTIAPMTGALAKVALLNPVTYKWNSDGSDGQGFIAHELDEVVKGCVTGEKDAVDKDGKPQYQGIDTSFLVATLTAAIQEQQAIIESLTARVSALEGN
jgi:hypothetical protein